MDEFKTFITFALGAVVALLTIAASVGAIEYGIGAGNHAFYAFAGVCNLLGWGGLIVYKAYKFIKDKTGDDEPKNE